MNFTSKGIAWIEKVGAKLENLCSEVDARSQEQLDYVESQLQIAGANLKQFCSEFIQEIFPASLSDAKEDETSNLSSEENIKKQLLASELSNIIVEEDNKKELSHSNSSSIVFPADTAEGVHIDFSLQPQADMVMKMSVEDNSEKAFSSGKSSGVVAFTERTLNMTSLPYEGDNGVEGHAKSSIIASVKCQESDPSMQVGKTIDFTYLKADMSNVPSLTCSPNSTESQDSAFPDFDEINSCAELPEISNGGESVDHHVNKPGIGTVPELEFDGNCVLVDKDDLSSCSEFYGAHISHKKNMTKLEVKPGNQRNNDTAIYEDLSVESEQSNTESKPKYSPIQKLELSEEVFCDSDWEII
ncbi:uncharacterized protein LOC107784291 isoform X1 [Nicotiana tabacum]|uniref:Uncharacterized protein LOC107784291 isoform X1 n=2 Tax=Nicotiana TaxID=4085 RepID=A0A1S3Z917_TOBAC|nr:PREDICTED: uncharacterized protein LOC104225762 isoform X1 [Nicotiana sylvestris]XP_016460883.1 PREDICTED: uncharacterized protein LOC107784291 isoform X1 [Nicotiana tabacum]